MSDSPKSRWREFAASPHHAVLAFATLGGGFLSAEPLFFVAGAAAYVVGWIFGPDLPVFRRYVEKKEATARAAAERLELSAFNTRRDAMIGGLSPERRQRYRALAEVCKEIETAALESEEDPRLRKIEELMWTNLRLLTMEQSLDAFLESEVRDNVPALLAAAQEETARLQAEVDGLKTRGASSALDARERLLTSRLELLETLGKRAERVETAKANLSLVLSEQERLDQQIKLIRADSIATRNATALSARIDSTVENLEHTNRWLADMDQFRDVLGNLPMTGQRAGFGEISAPPPLPSTTPRRKQSS